MEPTTIAIIGGVIFAVVIVLTLMAIHRGNRASVAAERSNATIPVRPSHIPVTIRRKNRNFSPYYSRDHDSWGFFLGSEWIVYDLLMDGAYLGLFDEYYPGEPFLPEEPGAYAPEPESAIEAAPEPVAPPEPEPVHESVSETPEPVRESFSEPVVPAPEPAPYDPPSEDRFGSSDFGSSDFGGDDFGGGD